jgi:hypothetical protein
MTGKHVKQAMIMLLPLVLPAGAVALPVLTSSLYDSYPENVGNLPTPVLCPAGEYVVGITAWTTFVFSTM